MFSDKKDQSVEFKKEVKQSNPKEEKEIKTPIEAPLNLFVFGTNAGRKISQKKSIISQFCEACADQTNTLVLDGTGAGSSNINKLFGLMGVGVDNAVSTAVKHILNQKPLPKQINMMGFSRGAVTCQRIAYKLNEVCPDIKIRMILLDPVAGPTNKGDKSAQILQGNVVECVVFAAMHENRKYMSMQDRIYRTKVMDPKKTSLHHLPIYGSHNDCNYETFNTNTNHVSNIVWQYAYQFFTAGGTRFKDDTIPKMLHRNKDRSFIEAELKVKSAQALLSDYDGMRANLDSYITVNSGFQIKPRSFLKDLDCYVVGGFVNQHERELCKICYPNAFNYLFEGAIGHKLPDRQYRKKIYNELALMEEAHPQLFKMINTAMQIQDEELDIVVPDHPSGLKLEEKLSLANKLTVNETTDHNLAYVLLTICQRYQRNTEEAKKRPYHDLADTIMTQVKLVMADEKSDKTVRLTERVNQLLEPLRKEQVASELLEDIDFVFKNHKPVERVKARKQRL